jgi:DNA-binding NarL/FixJ family response regulator
MITLVVADDHPVVRQGLVALLGTDPDIEVIGEAADGSEATDVVLSLRPSVVVMDLQMPVVDGVAATQAIKQVWPEAAIVVLTTYDSDEAIVRALEAGASGFVLKDTPPDDLIQAIRRAATGETVLSPPVAKRLVERMQSPESATLSSREIEVLREVANGNTNSVIADHLHISQATVKTHLLHIYTKLGVSDRAAAVARAYESGVLAG